MRPGESHLTAAGMFVACKRCAMPRLLGLLALLVGVGCHASTQSARTEQHARWSAVMKVDPSDRGGSLQGTLPNGEACKGTFGEMVTARAAAPGDAKSTDERSLAILLCGRDRVLRCTFVRGSERTFSFGQCRDQLGDAYDMVF